MLSIPRVAQYARFSSDNQRSESIDAQIRAMNQYCKQQHWQIVATYADEAYSATTDKRPQFQQMIADSSEKMFDVVLVHKLDRFARNRYDSCLYKQKLQKNNVRLCSVLERIDDSPESILLEGLIESINEFYSANLARESLKGLKENALKCIHNGESAGLGYDVDDTRHLVINQEEAKIVALVFSLCLCGYSCKVIAEMLNAEGYKTKRGTYFKSTSVYGLIRNEKYTGVYIFNRRAGKGIDGKRNSHKNKPHEEIIRIEGGIPAIISREVWETAQKMMLLKSRRLHNTKTMYLLCGKMTCGICGKTMYGSIRYRNDKTSFHTYVCRTKSTECSNYKEIDKESLESYVLGLIHDNCNIDSDFFDMPHDMPKFRFLLQEYIDSIIVYKSSVVFKINCGGTIKTIRHSRKAFKTPTQRCFSNKKGKMNDNSY